MTPARLIVDVPPSEADIMSGRLWSLGTNGIQEEMIENGCSTRLYAGFETVVEAEAAHLEIGRGDVVPVTNDEWLDTWRDHARVERAGRRFVVKPTWLPHLAEPVDIVIEVDPGRSFGSGSHPTTRLALAAIEDFVGPGARVLDVGCGSGVLGIGAALSGATQVTALDLDPEAVTAAAENAALNGVEEIVAVSGGSVDARVHGVHDVVVANILAVVLIELAPLVIASCDPFGTVIVSGLLERQADEVCTALQPFVEVARYAEDSWVALALQRPVQS